MKLKLALAVLLLLPVVSFAQSNNAQPSSKPAPAPGFSLPKGMELPNGLFEPFWDDPKTCDEIQITAAQKKQLREATVKAQLAMIDGGADALKALVHLAAISEAEDLDDAAYHQQLKALAAGFGKVIEELGDLAIAPRKVLTADQYQKLKALRKAKREAKAEKLAHPHPPKPADSSDAK